MKGLTQFIMDLRNARDHADETRRINLEINNIQAKFQAPLLGYQRKKYVSKLVYIHLLGYAEGASFGMSQPLTLVASSVYSEKHAGYLAISLLHRGTLDDLLDLTHAALLRDLALAAAESNCLALHFIASNFNAGAGVVTDADDNARRWLELIDVCYALATLPLSAPATRRKLVLALLVLARLYPAVLARNRNWVPRLLLLLDEPKDLGLLVLSVPLVRHIVEEHPQYAVAALLSVARRLSQLVLGGADGAAGAAAGGGCPAEYYYYDVPAPWLIVKLLALIETIFLLAPGGSPVVSLDHLDYTTTNTLKLVVSQLIQNALRPAKGLPSRNSNSSILFLGVLLVVFLNASADAVMGAVRALVLLLDLHETNTRYLLLDALTKLIARGLTQGLLFANEFDALVPQLLQLVLRDKDVLVKRKALDLLYTVCSGANYIEVVGGLLRYLPHCEAALRPELALKAAVLSEKFATDPSWYVTTMLTLVSHPHGAAGGAAALGASGDPQVWERIVQIIVNNEDLQALACRRVLLLFGSSTEGLVKVGAFVLGEYGHLVTAEYLAAAQFHTLYEAYFKVALATRAMLLTAFLKFAVKFADADFVPEIVDLFEMETQSIDLEIQTRASEYLKLYTVGGAAAVVRPFPVFEKRSSALMARISKTHPGRAPAVSAQHIRPAEPTGAPAAVAPATAPLTPNWHGYHRMLQYDAGIFYENQFVKILYRVVKRAHELDYQFTVINNAAKTAGTALTAFTVLSVASHAAAQDPSYLVRLVNQPQLTVATKTAFDVLVKVRHVVEAGENPVLTLSFKSGGAFNELRLQFPVAFLRTLTSTAAHLDDFKKRWLQIGEQLPGRLGEARGQCTAKYRYNSLNIVRLLLRLGFAVVHSTADDADGGILVMGMGILHAQDSNYGVLVTIRSTDGVGREFELLVRCTGGGVADVIVASLQEVMDEKI